MDKTYATLEIQDKMEAHMPVCPSCYSKKMKKRDFYHYKGESRRRWQCQNCGFTTAYPLRRKPMQRKRR